jgi:Flp pilus assembly protein protease CpaA
MIWLHGLFHLLLALATAINSRTRHVHNELILTGLCLSALWAWVQPGSGRMIWNRVPLSGLAITLLERWT